MELQLLYELWGKGDLVSFPDLLTVLIKAKD